MSWFVVHSIRSFRLIVRFVLSTVRSLISLIRSFRRLVRFVGSVHFVDSVRSPDCLFVRSLVCSFVGLFVRWFVRSFVLIYTYPILCIFSLL